MNANYESNTEESIIYINITNEKEAKKVSFIANLMLSWGYSMCHSDDEVYMLATNSDKTIKDMQEDYREAKKEV